MHLHSHLVTQQGFSGGFSGKQSACNGFNPWVGKILRRRKWQPTPVFLPEESHGEKSLEGYSPWVCKESDTTEQLTHTHTHTQSSVYLLILNS